MIFVSHRGNLNGPNPERENTLSYIQEALAAGFECEIDVWEVNGAFYLGHNGPDSRIDFSFLQENENKLWIHNKSERKSWMLDSVGAFRHTDESSVWIPDKKAYFIHSKLSNLSYSSIEISNGEERIGICSDYIEEFKKAESKYLVVLDFDGILSRNKIYDKFGRVKYKELNDLDFTFIKIFKNQGIPVVFLTGDSFNKSIADSRHIPYYDARGEDGKIDKSKFIEIFYKEYGVFKENLIYCGDDVFDVSLLREVGFSFCPNNSHCYVKNACKYILSKSGGEGLVQDIFDILCSKGIVDSNIDCQALIDIDAEEFLLNQKLENEAKKQEGWL